MNPFVKICFLFFLSLRLTVCAAQTLPGFKETGAFGEQELTITDSSKSMTLCFNAPLQFHERAKTYLVLFALPNGNSIEWTKGKKPQPGDDWHVDIQHIAAQMRFVRSLDDRHNYILVYLMAHQKSWPAWKRSTPGALQIIKHTVDSITGMFSAFQPEVVLNGHSGGGSFIFGYIDAVNEIPRNIGRIAFLDSEYGYNDSLHYNKLLNWLKQDKNHKLVALAYNDSIALYNGKPVVSATGGTWYRTRLMQRNLSNDFKFSVSADTSLIVYTALEGRIRIVLKENPQQLIYHTVQVEKNGFILSMCSATQFDNRKYFTYFGNRAYEQYIGD